MTTIVASILGLLMFGMLYSAGRAWIVFRTCTPAAANVKESTYTARQRYRDAPWGYGWYQQGRPGVRFIRDQVQFEDADGNNRLAWVSRWVSRRYAPYETYVVWYDPRSDRVTAIGPAYWLGCTVILAAIFAGLIVAAVQIDRIYAQRLSSAPARLHQEPPTPIS